MGQLQQSYRHIVKWCSQPSYGRTSLHVILNVYIIFTSCICRISSELIWPFSAHTRVHDFVVWVQWHLHHEKAWGSRDQDADLWKDTISKLANTLLPHLHSALIERCVDEMRHISYRLDNSGATVYRYQWHGHWPHHVMHTVLAIWYLGWKGRMTMVYMHCLILCEILNVRIQTYLLPLKTAKKDAIQET